MSVERARILARFFYSSLSVPSFFSGKKPTRAFYSGSVDQDFMVYGFFWGASHLRMQNVLKEIKYMRWLKLLNWVPVHIV